MNSGKGFLGVIAVVVLVVGLFTSAFIVEEGEQALVLQFGEMKRSETEPGLKFKLPFIQNVITLDKKLLGLTMSEAQMTTLDKDILFVDALAWYRIVDPLKYYTGLNNTGRAQNVLREIFKSQLQITVGKVSSSDVIRDKRSALMTDITKSLNNDLPNRYGVEIEAVRIRNVKFSNKVSSRIYRNMIVDLRKKANELRSNGQKIATDIRSKADSNVNIILAKAKANSAGIRAEGEAKRNQIFIESYGKNVEFFNFFRSLESYKGALGDKDTTLVISPDSAFFRYLGDPNGGKKAGAQDSAQ